MAINIEDPKVIADAINEAADKFQTVVETAISSFFGNLNLFTKALDGTIVQSDPITITIPKLTVWLKMPKETPSDE